MQLKITLILIFGFLQSTFLSATSLFDWTTSIEQWERPNLEPLDCIYVINLDTRPEKWISIQKMFAKENVIASRFKAIDGFDIPANDRDRLAPPSSKIQIGGIGCYLSHLSIFLHAFEQNFDYIWICEDDIVFLQPLSLISQMIQKLDALDPKWDMLWTEREWKNDAGQEVPGYLLFPTHHRVVTEYFEARCRKKNVSKEFQRTGLRGGGYSYILSKRGIQKCINHFESLKIIEHPSDGELHYIQGLREYCVRKDLVIHSPTSPFSDTTRKEKIEGENREFFH